MKFEGKIFEEFSEFIMGHWRASTEMILNTISGSEVDLWLSKWFEDNEEERINIGPFIGIHPYSKFVIDDHRNEYLFMYDDYDNTKITRDQLLLGRNDFVDVFK